MVFQRFFDLAASVGPLGVTCTALRSILLGGPWDFVRPLLGTREDRPEACAVNFFEPMRVGAASLLFFMGACQSPGPTDTPEPFVPTTPSASSTTSDFELQGTWAVERVVALEVKNLDTYHLFTDPEDEWFTQQTHFYSIAQGQVAEDGTLSLVESICQMDVSVVGGLDTLPGPGLIDALPPMAYSGHWDAAAQKLSTLPYADIWGAKLAEPLIDPLPQGPGEPGVWDQDEDGHPGVTIILYVVERDLVFGTIYVAQRVTFTLEGWPVGSDRFEGWVGVQAAEQVLLGAEEAYLGGAEPEVKPVMDQTLSYFEAERLPPGSGCEHWAGQASVAF